MVITVKKQPHINIGVTEMDRPKVGWRLGPGWEAESRNTLSACTLSNVGGAYTLGHQLC